MTEMTEIEIEREFDAPPEQVWAQWTQPEHFAGWYGGEAAEVEVHEWDLRVDGRWRATMRVNGMTIDWHGEFVTLDAPRRLVLTLTDRPGDERATCTVELADLGGRTAMRFMQVGPTPPEFKERTTEGWKAFFAALAARL